MIIKRTSLLPYEGINFKKICFCKYKKSFDVPKTLYTPGK